MIVKRDKRESFANDFNRKITFVQNIEILDVANEVNVNKTNNFIEIIVEKKDDEVKNEKNEKSEENEKNEKNNAKNFDFFACFVRTCS